MKTIPEIEALLEPGQLSGEDISVLINELKKIPPRGTYVEIGVLKGRSLSLANYILKKDRAIWGIDVNKDNELANFLVENPHLNFVWANNAFVSTVWETIGELIDLLFIDGDHSYEGCFADANNWLHLINAGGVMLFHDFDETSPGVIQAVDEFVTKFDLKLEFPLAEKSSIAKVSFPKL